jgi:hypothetical protein
MNRIATQGAGQIIGLIDGRQVVGLDVAKSVLQLHTVDMNTGEIVNVQIKRAKGSGTFRQSPVLLVRHRSLRRARPLTLGAA